MRYPITYDELLPFIFYVEVLICALLSHKLFPISPPRYAIIGGLALKHFLYTSTTKIGVPVGLQSEAVSDEDNW